VCKLVSTCPNLFLLEILFQFSGTVHLVFFQILLCILSCFLFLLLFLLHHLSYQPILDLEGSTILNNAISFASNILFALSSLCAIELEPRLKTSEKPLIFPFEKEQKVASSSDAPTHFQLHCRTSLCFAICCGEHSNCLMTAISNSSALSQNKSRSRIWEARLLFVH
jgi:hypothetical protein